MSAPRTIALGIAAALALASPAAAERLITTLSTSRVLISSNFTGADVVLFGSIERDAQTVPRRGGYDIVVTVTGPRDNIVTFRKERVAGIWVNADSRTFVKVPSYLTVLANKTINDIADINTLRRTQTGLQRTLLPQEISGDIAEFDARGPFRQAFLRLKVDQGLYRELQNGVTFLTPALFRASITSRQCADGQLRRRHQAVRRRHAADAHPNRAGGRQGRVRAVPRERRARLRTALRPADRDDGAAHRLVRQRGVQEGLSDRGDPAMEVTEFRSHRSEVERSFEYSSLIAE